MASYPPHAPGASPYPLTMALLAESGIDASIITVEGINASSYLEIVLDEKGNRIVNPNGSLAAMRREWGVPGLGEKVMAAMIEDIKNFPAIKVVNADGKVVNRVDHVVMLRRRYDMDRTEENAAAWLKYENTLSDEEFPAYLALYRALPEIDPEEPAQASPSSDTDRSPD